MRTAALSATVAAIALSAAYVRAENRELGAHEHGRGALNIAVEGNTVLMEFEAPGADIVGFEHRAESAADRAAVDEAVAALSQPMELFIPLGEAECVVSNASVELVSESGDHAEHGHEGHGDDRDDHAHDEHAHDEHEDDDHDHGHETAEGEHNDEEQAEEGHGDHESHAEGEGEGHTEFHAEYALFCSDPAAIRTLDFAYFSRFPNAAELEIQLISEKGATAFEVKRDAPRLDIGGAI